MWFARRIPSGCALALCLALAIPAAARGQQRHHVLEQAQALDKQAADAYREGRYAAAEPLYQQALQLRQSVLPPDRPAVVKSLTELGRVYRVEGRYAEAEPLFQTALAMREKTAGPDNPAVAQILVQLAQIYFAQARYGEAEPLRERVVAILEKSVGENDPRFASALANLAALYRLEGRYAEAEPLVTRAVALEEKALDPDPDGNADRVRVLALLYQAQGRQADAVQALQHLIGLEEKQYGVDHPALATTLDALGRLYIAKARFAEAEPLYQRALAIREKALGAEHPLVGQSVDALALLYRFEGRSAEAEGLAKRALAIREKTRGAAHPAVAQSLANLAFIEMALRRYDAAEPLFRRALAIRETVFGAEHRLVAATLGDLAQLATARGDAPEKIEPLLKQALAIQEKVLDPNHPDTAKTLDLLATLYRTHGKAAAAEPLVKRALAIQEKSLGPDHPLLSQTLNDLARIYQAEGHTDLALEQSRRALDIFTRHLDTEAAHKLTDDPNDERNHRGGFLLNIALTEASVAHAPDKRAAMVKDTFRTAQFAQSSSAAAALAGMAARFAAGDDGLATVVRERQDVVEQHTRLDAALIAALSRPANARNPAEEAALRNDLTAASKHLETLDARIAKEFPAYAELSNPQPVSLEAAQALLGADEALLVYVVGPRTSWLWAARRTAAQLYDVKLDTQTLAVEVQALRTSLDPQLNPSLRPFPATRAYQLYQKLLAPAAPMLAGAHHVMVVPDGALMSLPIGVLVTKPGRGDPNSLADHRDVAWLARDHAVTVLPAVGSLRALRQFAEASKASSPFLGVGDPVLKGASGGTRGTVQIADLFRGGIADADKVRALPPLPETAEELRSVAATLHASDASLYLEERASEPLLYKAALERYRVIEFATHGLVSGEITGLTEPALVLTPPVKTSPDNDGLLTASKIARLKLDADWVVLSACNTAASDGTPGADGLSGLAKAFFYAGSRALLVSNWSVASKAAVKLTTGAFAALAAEPTIGRAEALRRAELALLDDTTLAPAFAHPMIWAPFTIVGEGGAGR